jgi:hypothetical protein
MKTINIIANDVQLMLEDEKLGEAVASISLNPNVTWLRMVITDDKPNANNMRIPREEFASVIKTAVYMPLKMAAGKISEGHEDTLPIGSIAHLAEEEDHIVALAALWNKERPDDIKFLKDRYENGQNIDVSWELNYDVTASEKNDDGILELKDVAMNAVTIVGLPSYMGRTGVTALASKDEDEGESEAMDTIKREDHDKIVKTWEEKVEGFEVKMSEASTRIEELETLTEELTTAKAELEEIKPKYEELEKFKAEADAAKQREEKLVSIREKFAEAGIEVTDEYMEEREETLLGMEEASLDFFIQELVSFKTKEGDDDEAEASVNLTSKLPDLKRKSEKDVEPDDIVAGLRELDKKK